MNWAPNWTREKLGGSVGFKFGQAKVPSSYWEEIELWLWAVHSVHAGTAQNWTLDQGLPCAPFCGGVMLLGSRAGPRLASAAHTGWGHSFASYPHHISSGCITKNAISHKWASPGTSPGHPIQVCTSVLELFPAKPLSSGLDMPDLPELGLGWVFQCHPDLCPSPGCCSNTQRSGCSPDI